MKNSDILPGFNGNIYKQCIWVMKDYYRLMTLSEIDKLEVGSNALLIGIREKNPEEDNCVLGQNVIEDAKFKMECISRALMDIPEEYRDGIFKNIVDKEKFEDDACDNTWKRWKLVFIHNLAGNLNLC